MTAMKSALVTGCSTGIGRCLVLELANKGYVLTLLDVDSKGLSKTVSDIRALFPSASVTPVVADVSCEKQQEAAFQEHVARHGSLDIAVLNAGVGERGSVFDAANKQWQSTLDIDLTAVIVGVRLSAQAMLSRGTRGTIICVASAGAFFPMPVSPVYAAAKAGLVQFVRSAAPGLHEQGGVRLMAACPEFTDTPLVQQVLAEGPAAARKLMGRDNVKLLRPEQVCAMIMDMMTDKHEAGTVLLLRQNGTVVDPVADPSAAPRVRKPYRRPPPLPAAARASNAAWALQGGPSSYRKIEVHQLSNKFSEATRIVMVPLPPSSSLPRGHILMRRVYTGINASDINYTAGRYYGSASAAQSQLPFDAGFESVNIVAGLGPGVKGFQVGDPVASLSYGGFSEFAVIHTKHALPVPRATPDVLALLTSGLTASIALSDAGRLRAGQVVLVTAAAGGTGQFAVQLAKLAGAKVVATCGGPHKAEALRKLGADRVIDYTSENVQAVLKSEYPNGVDVVYESVGGKMFDTCVNALAQRGRLIVIGMMSQYASGWSPSQHTGLADKLLWKSAGVEGFFLLRYASKFREHLDRLVQLVDSGKLSVNIDPKRFMGVEAVAEAVEYLYSGKSIGKVVVQMNGTLPPVTATSKL